ncbi:helix-turn-helix domain-containing protein [Microbacterium sp. BR1]|uniref:helix-turn-helix domain-containing protein n=1 Tax=Microbacterium sp. BR1 TaxID=1070896 RepID=UPI000C2B6C90|nr:helix-turn-helix domain-containing protein [Microbacterium sp. BR1]
MPKNEDMIGVAEAAKLLHRDVRTVHRQIESGAIPHLAKLPGLRGAYVLSRAEVENIARAERAA